jgi:hypothetical protein
MDGMGISFSEWFQMSLTLGRDDGTIWEGSLHHICGFLIFIILGLACGRSKKADDLFSFVMRGGLVPACVLEMKLMANGSAPVHSC